MCYLYNKLQDIINVEFPALLSEDKMIDDNFRLLAEEKVKKIARKLEEEINSLKSEGYLSDIDFQMIIDGAYLSGTAVKKALTETNYPNDMRVELINRLIEEFENSTNDVLESARDKKYSIEISKKRLENIDNKAIELLKNTLEKTQISRDQFDRKIREIKTKHRQVISDISTIPKKHPRKGEMIDNWIVEYEKQILSFASAPSNLDYSTSMKLDKSKFSSKLPEGQNISKEVTSKQKKKIFGRLFSKRGKQ